MDDDKLVVATARFDVEEPFRIPDVCTPVSLRRSTDGGVSRLETVVGAYADDDRLTVVFNGTDDGVVATLLKHDEPLYQEDVVELFLSPHDPTEYFEIEVNPLGTVFDARIVSPDGVRRTMRADTDWNCEGLRVGIRKTPQSLDATIRIPFRSLGLTQRPKKGDMWRGNLFRVDRSPTAGDEFMAWRPTMKNPPDFHVVAAFGRLVFD